MYGVLRTSILFVLLPRSGGRYRILITLFSLSCLYVSFTYSRDSFIQYASDCDTT
ncbi:hypothetical protein BDV32DRAFT_116629, partial [Aspergillus pseudonomiae]